jgi:hypothetical protein
MGQLEVLAPGPTPAPNYPPTPPLPPPQVYDITEHVVSHPGWDGAGVSTVLSILAHLGTDCSAEFEEIHRPYPVAWRQLAAFDIGPLEGAAGAAAGAARGSDSC